jgi:Transposase DDE domain
MVWIASTRRVRSICSHSERSKIPRCSVHGSAPEPIPRWRARAAIWRDRLPSPCAARFDTHNTDTCDRSLRNTSTPDQKIYFVTRLKDNAAYEVLEEGPVPANSNIRSDQLIRFTGEKAQRDCPCLLRRVVVWDAINEREIVLLTNLMEFGSTTIAAIYKDRWEIELFFESWTWCTPLDVM